MGAREWLFENPFVYSAWQAPFAASKFAPVERRLRDLTICRVLDLGCGAGTNAGRFANYDYVGVDMNERYLEAARRRYRGHFINADLTETDISGLGTFDTVLVNSFLHHVSDAHVEQILAQIPPVLSNEGRVHILELVLPQRLSMARVMARLDRGRFARPIDDWRRLFGAAFEPVVVEPYLFGGGLWSMVYFQGRVR